MTTAQKSKTESMTKPDIPGSSGPASRNRLTGYGLSAVTAESILAGVSLFAAFIMQRSFFNLGVNQFLIGDVELLKMSAGISFCYAFVFVLKRGYHLSGPERFFVSTKRQARYAAETYVIFLAMLFLIKDINLASARLSLGLGFILCLIGFGAGREVLNLFYRKQKTAVPIRSITLKKPPMPAPANPDSFANSRIDIAPITGKYSGRLNQPSGVFIINSGEDIKRLELMAASQISFARIGNLSLKDIPEAVKAARRRGLRLELTPFEENEKRRKTSVQY